MIFALRTSYAIDLRQALVSVSHLLSPRYRRRYISIAGEGLIRSDQIPPPQILHDLEAESSNAIAPETQSLSQLDPVSADQYRTLLKKTFRALFLQHSVDDLGFFQQLQQQKASSNDRINDALPRNVWKRRPDMSYIRTGGDKNPLNGWAYSLKLLEENYDVASDRKAVNIIKFSSKEVPSQNTNTNLGFPKYPIALSQRSLSTYIHQVATCQATPRFYDQFRTNTRDRKEHWINLQTWKADEIDRVLHSLELRKFLSPESCNTALSFFYKHQMWNRARALRYRMEYINMPPSIDTWNIILSGAAHRKDMHNFNIILEDMINKGIKPDAATWTKLLRVVYSAEGRAQVACQMSKTVLNSSRNIKRSVRHLTIRDKYREYRSEHPQSTAADFISSVDVSRTVEPGWLTPVIGHHMIWDTLREPGKAISEALLDCISLLHTLRQGSMYSPETRTLDLLLSSCNSAPKLAISAMLIGLFYRYWKVLPAMKSFEILFTRAWRARRICFLRVLWIAASLSGPLSLNTRSRVRDSVLQRMETFRTSDSDSSKPLPFKELAGSFVLGLCTKEPLTGLTIPIEASGLSVSENYSPSALDAIGIQHILDKHLLMKTKADFVGPSLCRLLIEAWQQDERLAKGRIWDNCLARDAQLELLASIPNLSARMFVSAQSTSLPDKCKMGSSVE